MDEKDSERALNSLDARLKQARQAQKGPATEGGPRLRGEASGFGQALRVGAELVSALIVGTGLGLLLDYWLGTKPWLMIVFIFLGGGAGILNVYRVAMSMAGDTANGPKHGPENGPSGAVGKDSRAKEREN